MPAAAVAFDAGTTSFVRCAACGRITVCDGFGTDDDEDVVGRVDDERMPREYPAEKTSRNAVMLLRCGRSMADTPKDGGGGGFMIDRSIDHGFFFFLRPGSGGTLES